MERGAGSGTLTVRVAERQLKLPGWAVAEILRLPVVTRVPLAPRCLLGVINRRGQMMPVLSLASLLGQPDSVSTPATRIVVVEDGLVLGVLVDEVLAFGAAGEGEILDIPALVTAEFGAPTRLPSQAVGAAPRPATAPVGVADELALVVLRLAGQDYAFRLDDVVEIIALPSGVTILPGADPAMVGMIESRVGLLPLLSLSIVLALGPDRFDPAKARVVIIALAGRFVGLVADTVTSVLRVPCQAIEPVPPVLTRGKAEARVEAICRLEGGRRLVSLLSSGHLLDPETTLRLQAQAQIQAQFSPVRDFDMPVDLAISEQFVVVQMGAEAYGLPVEVVVEVVRHPGALTPVPHAPDFVAGVMNLRGKIVPVLDQRRRFGIAVADPATWADDRRVVILRAGAVQVGFVVDAASEMMAVHRSEMHDAPALTTVGSRIFDRIATRHGGRTILLVNPRALLDDAEREWLAGLVQAPEIVRHK